MNLPDAPVARERFFVSAGGDNADAPAGKPAARRLAFSGVATA
jgi:hypothetical protein